MRTPTQRGLASVYRAAMLDLSVSDLKQFLEANIATQRALLGALEALLARLPSSDDTPQKAAEDVPSIGEWWEPKPDRRHVHTGSDRVQIVSVREDGGELCYFVDYYMGSKRVSKTARKIKARSFRAYQRMVA